MRPILEHINQAQELLEDAPEPTTDCEALVRIKLANTLAKAAQILRALAADADAGK
jgi:hypothetical protein